MTKAEIVEKIADKTGFTQNETRLVVEQLLEEIKTCLTRDDHLEVRGFGTFKVKNCRERLARNPRTNREVTVPQRKKAIFKVSKELNEQLN